jgi:hypothetical protein
MPMHDDAKSTLEIFARAVFELLRDEELAYADPSERAIVVRLRDHLHNKYADWSIDLEWTRRENVNKRLSYGLTQDGQTRQGAIVPDLIVHHVGKKENLLVVEVKKVTNIDFDGDIWKLRGMTEQAGEYAYLIGLHLVIDVKNRIAPRSDVYVDANLNEELSAWMQAQLKGAVDVTAR